MGKHIGREPCISLVTLDCVSRMVVASSISFSLHFISSSSCSYMNTKVVDNPQGPRARCSIDTYSEVVPSPRCPRWRAYQHRCHPSRRPPCPWWIVSSLNPKPLPPRWPQAYPTCSHLLWESGSNPLSILGHGVLSSTARERRQIGRVRTRMEEPTMGEECISMQVGRQRDGVGPWRWWGRSCGVGGGGRRVG